MPEKGPKEIMQFTEKKLTGNESPSCVDGRPGSSGHKMLGASLHPAFLKALVENGNFGVLEAEDSLKKLKEAGFSIGVHRGHHKDTLQGKSDCGFSDRLIDIIQTAKNNKDEIIKRLKDAYIKNEIDAETLSTSYDFITNYNISKIAIAGEQLISLAEANGAAVENLEGDHQEMVAFVNLKENITLDAQELNKQGKQAFDLDLWAAIKQSSVLVKNASVETLRDLSLILYQATEMVLVEQKDKPALEVILHK